MMMSPTVLLLVAYCVPLLLLLGRVDAFHGTAFQSSKSEGIRPSRPRPLAPYGTTTATTTSFLQQEIGGLSDPTSEQSQTNNYMRQTSREEASGQAQETEALSPLDPAWITAAQQSFSWDAAATDTDDVSAWQKGERWFVTREALMDLWVLPRDVSKGSWDNYAQAATKAEETVLNQVPQLLRLDPQAVVAAARTVLNDLALPPALLRKEPLLLAMDATRLRGGFDSIPSSPTSSAADACRDTPGLLLQAATRWIPSEEGAGAAVDAAPTKTETNGTDQGNVADNMMLLQQSFDNEVFASDLHMESFLDSKEEDEKKK